MTEGSKGSGTVSWGLAICWQAATAAERHRMLRVTAPCVWLPADAGSCAWALAPCWASDTVCLSQISYRSSSSDPQSLIPAVLFAFGAVGCVWACLCGRAPGASIVSGHGGRVVASECVSREEMAGASGGGCLGHHTEFWRNQMRLGASTAEPYLESSLKPPRATLSHPYSTSQRRGAISTPRHGRWYGEQVPIAIASDANNSSWHYFGASPKGPFSATANLRRSHRQSSRRAAGKGRGKGRRAITGLPDRAGPGAGRASPWQWILSQSLPKFGRNHPSIPQFQRYLHCFRVDQCSQRVHTPAEVNFLVTRMLWGSCRAANCRQRLAAAGKRDARRPLHRRGRLRYGRCSNTDASSTAVPGPSGHCSAAAEPRGVRLRARREYFAST